MSQQVQQSYQSQQSQLVQAFTLYKANKDEPHRNQLIDFMNSMPLDAWQSEVKLFDLEKDIKALIIDAKLAQITSEHSTFIFPLSSSLENLIQRYITFKVNFRVNGMAIAAVGALAASDGNLSQGMFFLSEISSAEAGGGAASAQSDTEDTSSPRRKRARVDETDTNDTPYRLAWIRQLVRLLNEDLDNWTGIDTLFDTENVLMSCYDLHSNNTGFKRKLFLTREYVFAQAISTSIVGFERLLLEDIASFELFSRHKVLLDKALGFISNYYPDRLIIMASALPDFESFTKDALNLSEPAFEDYKTRSGFLGIKLLFEGFISFIHNPHRLSNGFSKDQIERCRFEKLSSYNPDAIIVKLLIDLDGAEGLRHLSLNMREFIHNKDYEKIVDCPLKNDLLELEQQRVQLLTWEKALAANKLKAAYTLPYQITPDARKTVFVLLDCSASMGWAANQNNADDDDDDDDDAPIFTRWDMAKRFLYSMLEQLNDDDRILIILFNDSVRTLMPDLMTVGSLRDDFPELIEGASPSGGTQIVDAFSEVNSYISQTEDFEPNLSQIVIITDDDIHHGALDGEDNLRVKYEVETGFTGAYPAVFAVKTLEGVHARAASQMIVDSFHLPGSLMDQLKRALPNIDFVVNVHDTGSVNDLFFHLRKAYSGFSVSQVHGALNLYCEDMPELELDPEEESEQEYEDDFDESVSEEESEEDEDEVREDEDSDETEDEIFDMEPDDAHAQLMQLSQQVVSSVFASIPGLNAGFADSDEDDEDLDELSTRLIAKHGLDILHLPLSRSYINWFKKDYFDKSNIGSWFITSLCCNRKVDANEIAPLPEEVQKLIFGFLSHSGSYVNPKMQIQLRKVDIIPPALTSQVCTQDQVNFLIRSLSSRQGDLVEDIHNLETEFLRYVARSITKASDVINSFRRILSSVMVPENRLQFDKEPYFLKNWEHVLYEISSTEIYYHKHVVLSHLPLMSSPVLPYAQSILSDGEGQDIDEVAPDCLVS